VILAVMKKDSVLFYKRIKCFCKICREKNEESKADTKEPCSGQKAKVEPFVRINHQSAVVLGMAPDALTGRCHVSDLTIDAIVS
jgi:hypothetical protein